MPRVASRSLPAARKLKRAERFAHLFFATRCVLLRMHSVNAFSVASHGWVSFAFTETFPALDVMQFTYCVSSTAQAATRRFEFGKMPCFRSSHLRARVAARASAASHPCSARRMRRAGAMPGCREKQPPEAAAASDGLAATSMPSCGALPHHDQPCQRGGSLAAHLGLSGAPR